MATLASAAAQVGPPGHLALADLQVAVSGALLWPLASLMGPALADLRATALGVQLGVPAMLTGPQQLLACPVRWAASHQLLACPVHWVAAQQAAAAASVLQLQACLSLLLVASLLQALVPLQLQAAAQQQQWASSQHSLMQQALTAGQRWACLPRASAAAPA